MVIVFSCAMRILPVPVYVAHRVVTRWSEDEAIPEERRTALRRSCELLDVAPSPDLGAIAVCAEEEPRAVALLERVEDTVYVWDVACRDDSSGTLLMKAMVSTKAAVQSGPTLHPRWRAAAAYWRSGIKDSSSSD